MAGMSETCNHVAALFFRVEAAVTSGLTNTSCTVKSCEWLPNRKDVKPIKLKDINLQRDDFGKQGEKSRRLVPSPKKNYNPIATTGLPQSWKVLEREKGPGKSWNFTYFCRKSWKGPGILYSSFHVFF